MLIRLIINADDFGLTPGINRAVAELFDAGCLTSATLMANGPAFEDAVDIARARPGLGIGCHLVLVDGHPLSAPETIPSLLGEDGKTFRSSLISFAAAALLGRLNADEIAREALAQVQRLQHAGIDVTHVDTHKHTHIFPAVAGPLLQLLEKTGVACIRNPFEPRWSASTGRSLLRRLVVRALHPLRTRFENLPELRRASILTTDGTLGISATGDLDASSLPPLLRRLPVGTWELVCHPGYNDEDLDRVKTRLRREREVERNTLLEAFRGDSSQLPGVELIHYGNLGGFGTLRAEGLFHADTGYETFGADGKRS